MIKLLCRIKNYVQSDFDLHCPQILLVLSTVWKILDSFQQQGFVEDNFKFDEIGRKVSKRVEYTVCEGEIAF